MKNHVALPSFTLRTKLVLSYVGVALGAILILSIVITQVVQYSFAHQQHDMFLQNEDNDVQRFGILYHNSGSNWNNIPPQYFFNSDPGSPEHSGSYQNLIEELIVAHNHGFGNPQLVDLINTNSTVNYCLDQASRGSGDTRSITVNVQ